MTHLDISEAEPATLVLTEDEESLRGAVQHLLSKHSPWQDVLRRIASDQVDNHDLWRRIAADMGLAGLAIPENLGGQGASWREVSVVAKEVGGAVAPVPFFSSSVLATAVLLEVGASALLSEMAGGDLIVVCAIPFASGPGTATSDDVRVLDGLLTGSVRGVADAAAARRFLVPTDVGLHVVERDEVTIRPAGSFDPTRPLFDVDFDAAAGVVIADLAQTRMAMERGLRIGGAVLASEMVGAGQAALSSVIEYVKHRVQFGRVIGSYQAIKHQLVDAWILLEQADSAARYAACCVASRDPDQDLAVAVAKGFASDAVVAIAEKTVQLHGGIGFTWENPSHLYLKRAKADALGLGSRGQHVARVGELADLVPPGHLGRSTAEFDDFLPQGTAI